MKIINQLSSGLNIFRSFSPNHSIVFKWDGTMMRTFQNGTKRNFSGAFLGAFMPTKSKKGIILPSLINKLIEIQGFIDTNSGDVVIAPDTWGYKIYLLDSKGKHSPSLVYEFKFYSIKGWFPLLLAKLSPTLRTALKNV